MLRWVDMDIWICFFSGYGISRSDIRWVEHIHNNKLIEISIEPQYFNKNKIQKLSTRQEIYTDYSANIDTNMNRLKQIK